MLMFKISHRPMGKLLKCSPRLTLAHNCGRRSGQLQVVRAAGTFNISHRPDGKLLTRLPRLTLARLQTHFGQLQWVRAAETLNTSHLVLVLKNSRWEFLLTCPIDSLLSIGIFYHAVRSTRQPRLQNPIAPIGKVPTRLPRLSPQLRPTLRSTSGCTCRS